ncbi:MAG: BspA family leucine-rich repeat surface protein [Lactobacillus helsingborgensis]|nr:BspA family leucine-rich repeat surface protein [Lactobacillus helsingborgensis]
MFLGCAQLPELNVSHFNTSNVTNMKEMFALCQSLTTLDLSDFNIEKTTIKTTHQKTAAKLHLAAAEQTNTNQKSHQFNVNRHIITKKQNAHGTKNHARQLAQTGENKKSNFLLVIIGVLITITVAAIKWFKRKQPAE